MVLGAFFFVKDRLLASPLNPHPPLSRRGIGNSTVALLSPSNSTANGVLSELKFYFFISTSPCNTEVVNFSLKAVVFVLYRFLRLIELNLIYPIYISTRFLMTEFFVAGNYIIPEGNSLLSEFSVFRLIISPELPN